MVHTQYPNLDSYLRSWGLNVVEVGGWKERSANSTTFTPKAVIVHHTAGPAAGNAPTLQYITENTLAQFVLGRDGTVYLVSGNRTNHAGVGGPIRGIPKDAGNRFAWGVEAENTGRGEQWSEPQMRAYYRLCAALCDLMGVNEESVLAHKEWAPSRKTDPAGVSMSSFRSNVATALRAGKDNITPSDPILNEGDRGHSVINVQNALIKHGFKVEVDGDFGPATEKAVIDFQKEKSLEPDGIVGPKTWAALRLAPVVIPAPGPVIAPALVVNREPVFFEGGRMLVQFEGDAHVYEVVGSFLVHVTADAFKARELKRTDVKIVPTSHPLNNLAKKNEY